MAYWLRGLSPCLCKRKKKGCRDGTKAESEALSRLSCLVPSHEARITALTLVSDWGARSRGGQGNGARSGVCDAVTEQFKTVSRTFPHAELTESSYCRFTRVPPVCWRALNDGGAELRPAEALQGARAVPQQGQTGDMGFLLVPSEEKQKPRGSAHLPEVLRRQQRTSGLSWGSAAVRKALGYFPPCRIRWGTGKVRQAPAPGGP